MRADIEKSGGRLILPDTPLSPPEQARRWGPGASRVQISGPVLADADLVWSRCSYEPSLGSVRRRLSR